MIKRRLDQRLAPIVVVRGPRQIGKTTAQLQLIEQMLAEGVRPERIFRIQFDELSSLRGIDEPILKRTLNEAARAGEPAVLFLDEVQDVSNWAPQLKSLVDNATVQVVVTDSSALRIETGRYILAGRITMDEADTP